MLSTGWARGCSLHMCHAQVGLLLFSIKRQHNVLNVLSNSYIGAKWVETFQIRAKEPIKQIFGNLQKGNTKMTNSRIIKIWK